jgi:hypothetical protein
MDVVLLRSIDYLRIVASAGVRCHRQIPVIQQLLGIGNRAAAIYIRTEPACRIAATAELTSLPGNRGRRGDGWLARAVSVGSTRLNQAMTGHHVLSHP